MMMHPIWHRLIISQPMSSSVPKIISVSYRQIFLPRCIAAIFAMSFYLYLEWPGLKCDHWSVATWCFCFAAYCCNHLELRCRFDPKNVHQRPRVAVMCGSGSGSAVAVNCARYLAGRGIHVTLFIPDCVLQNVEVAAEMRLLGLCDRVVKTSNCNGMFRHFLSAN